MSISQGATPFAGGRELLVHHPPGGVLHLRHQHARARVLADRRRVDVHIQQIVDVHPLQVTTGHTRLVISAATVTRREWSH